MHSPVVRNVIRRPAAEQVDAHRCASHGQARGPCRDPWGLCGESAQSQQDHHADRGWVPLPRHVHFGGRGVQWHVSLCSACRCQVAPERPPPPRAAAFLPPPPDALGRLHILHAGCRPQHVYTACCRCPTHPPPPTVCLGLDLPLAPRSTAPFSHETGRGHLHWLQAGEACPRKHMHAHERTHSHMPCHHACMS